MRNAHQDFRKYHMHCSTLRSLWSCYTRWPGYGNPLWNSLLGRYLLKPGFHCTWGMQPHFVNWTQCSAMLPDRWKLFNTAIHLVGGLFTYAHNVAMNVGSLPKVCTLHMCHVCIHSLVWVCFQVFYFLPRSRILEGSERTMNTFAAATIGAN